MSDNESEPRTDVPEDHLVLDPMPVFDDPAEETQTPESAVEDGDTGATTTAPARVSASEDASGKPTDAPAHAATGVPPEPLPDAGPTGDGTPVDTATSGETVDPSDTPGNPDDPSAQMWASVRNRAPAHPDDDRPGDAPVGTAEDGAPVEDGRPEDTPAITGEEVSLTTAEDTSEIVGEVDSSQLETGTIEPVPTATSRIPVIATTGTPSEQDATPPPPTTGPLEEGRADLPTQPPRDVLENRRTPAGATDPSPAADGTAEGPGIPVDAPPEPAALDETAVRRRSLVVPAAPVPDQAATETSWHPRSEDAPGSRAASTPGSLDDALFEGSTVVPVVPSRTAAHVWGLLLSVLLVPLAWFALADAGARMTLATDAPMVSGTLNFAALLELLGGLLAVIVLALLVARSSLGAHVTGALVTILGIPWVVAPGWTAHTVLPTMDRLNSWNAFGQNFAHHLQSSGYSGRLLLLGVVLLLAGMVSHHVRRRGRAEETLRSEVERVNPAGAHLTARARRAAARAQRDQGR